jgi:hypothetical protein
VAKSDEDRINFHASVYDVTAPYVHFALKDVGACFAILSMEIHSERDGEDGGVLSWLSSFPSKSGVELWLWIGLPLIVLLLFLCCVCLIARGFSCSRREKALDDSNDRKKGWLIGVGSVAR